ncbi:beta-xylosidase, partial [Streptomyces bobili]|uniref:GH39 family glycosyl hydrolase n=1 Tax=Streptomyces bobili TaxID=67280 RepID=UPI003668C98B
MPAPRILPNPPGDTGRPARAGARLRAATAVTALLGSLAAVAVPAGTAQAADTTVTVDFATTGGAPGYGASGTLYGMSPDGSLPQEHFYKDIKWKFMRAGGAQLNSGGYGTSLAAYQTRWDSTLAQYNRTRALGGTFVLLPHDLWGADSTTSQGWPGDNGDWTRFNDFLDQLIGDVQANNMTVQWDIWNEPDNRPFWGPSQTQYLEMWKRAHQKIRAAFPNAVVVGPSTYRSPAGTASSWWNTYLDYVKANNVEPDIYSWHTLPGDPVNDATAVRSKLAARSMTTSRPFQVNEYGNTNEQNPGRGGWYISRLERAGADGVRANWASAGNLHDFQANLLTRTGSQYLPLGEWFLYRYYGSQTGNIVKFTPGTGTDGFATKDNTARNAKILLGSNGNTGSVTVDLDRLDTTSLVENGRVRAVVQRVPNNGGGAVTGPVTVSDQTLTVSGNSASVTVPWTNAS